MAERTAADTETVAWFGKLIALFCLPSTASSSCRTRRTLFSASTRQLLDQTENEAILQSEAAQKVLAAFAQRVRGHEGAVTPEQFKAWMNEIKAETGAKGKELFHPVRIALTGAHSGPSSTS